jgi:hypothetical protein
LARGWRGIIDLVTIQFLRRYHSKPGHFFTGSGALFFVVALLVFIFSFVPQVAGGSSSAGIYLSGIVGLAGIILGFVAISIGFLAELVLFLSRGPSAGLVSVHVSEVDNKS